MMVRQLTSPLLLSSLLFFFTIIAETKRGGGGGTDTDGGSGSSSDGDGGGDDAGSSPSSGGVQEVYIDAPHWPYRFPGSYYNGTITVEASILRWPDCTSGLTNSITATFDGILNIGPRDEDHSFSGQGPAFGLVAWDKGTTPTTYWTGDPPYNPYQTDDWKLFSTDVRVMINRYEHAYARETDTVTKWDDWLVKSQTGDGAGNFKMNGTAQTGLTPRFPGWGLVDFQSSSYQWYNITAKNCAGANDDFIMVPIAPLDADTSAAAHISQSLLNHTMQGTFNDSEAAVTWYGSYAGGFLSDSADFENTGPVGTVNVTFRGTLDKAQSDHLTNRATPVETWDDTINTAEWDISIDRTTNEPDDDTTWKPSGSDGSSASSASSLQISAVMIATVVGTVWLSHYLV